MMMPTKTLDSNADHQPLVTIVTPSLNQGKFIERTIRSVLAQDYPRIEYIVIDGMSSDETASVLQKYEPLITKVIRGPDSGQANAINKGFRTTNGEILAWLNSDDCYSSATTVSDAVSFLTDQPTCDLVYGRRKYIDAHGNHVAKIRPFREFSSDALKLWGYIPQECCFWRRGIYERAGGYIDESYEIAMDYELWIRMLKNGARFYAVDRFFGLYRTHAEAKSTAKWESAGLKEIANVHMQYCEKTPSPLEMHLASVDYYTGFKRSNLPFLNSIRSAIWSFLENSTVTASKGTTPLDQWSFRHDARLIERSEVALTTSVK